MDIFMRQINSYGASAVINTGDIADYNAQGEYDTYLAESAHITQPLYNLPGGHDEGPAGGPYDFALYDANLPNSRHWTFDIGPFRFIGTTGRMTIPIDGTGYMDADEVTWLLNELANLDGQIPIIMQHDGPPNILDSGGQNMVTMCGTYGVKLWLHGHGHNDMTVYQPNANLRVVTCPAPTFNGTPLNVDGGFGLIYVYTNRLEIAYIRAKEPWDEIIDPAIYPSRIVYKLWG